MFLKWYFKGIVCIVLSSLNKLATATKGTKRFSNPQALSSALAALGMLQPQAFQLLNRLVLLVLVSIIYILTKDPCFIDCTTLLYVLVMYLQSRHM